MAIKIAIKHRTEYHFDKLINLSPHVIRLKPAPHTRTPVHQYSIKIEPKDHFINWIQDPFGNFNCRLVFPEKTKKLSIEVNLVADLVTINPFDFFVEDYAEYYPFKYTSQEKKELSVFFEKQHEGSLFKQLLSDIKKARPGLKTTLAGEANRPKKEQVAKHTLKAHIVHYLVELNQMVYELIDYNIRMEPGVQTCAETLKLKSGSCRDSAWLLVQLLRHLGLAARFVSGYLVQLKADVESLDGPSGPEQDFTDLHAWTEVFIPGAGWIGLDPTSGLFAGEGHIPLACTPDPVSAAPIVGATDPCEVKFEFENKVTRIHQDPRVTYPYTDKQWNKINKLGNFIDKKLKEQDVRLTMGGEPTFVSVDDMDGAEWNTEALGEHKLDRAQALFLKIRESFAYKPVLQYGQGKWYPGEQLPRWAMTCAWLTAKQPIWNNQSLLADPNQQQHYDISHASALMNGIVDNLGLESSAIRTAYEDVPYYLWKEGTLPDNVSVEDNRLSDKMERARIRKVFDQGLTNAVGLVIPCAISDTEKPQWITSEWTFKREHMYLIPGDSAMGYRLPLDSLPWESQQSRHKLIDKDPLADFSELSGDLPSFRVDKSTPTTQKINLTESSTEAHPLVRTALCVEPRDGHLHVFLPPVTELEHYLDLISAIEKSAQQHQLSIILEGYEPPFDPRLQRIQVTPDPGVIEVNIHPSTNWKDLVYNTTTLYEQARLSRLATEKFMLDGRHSGTGGGNHITIGAAKPADSPALRRPQLLKSLLSYWQNHPGLSYLFSGLFIGPTSQSPRVDEARDDALYELQIAFSQLQNNKNTSPWIIDRLLRNLLVDVTGNTHRAEFCIDKLYSPNGSSGRLGLVEFRGFEMPPHAQMSLVQALLLRSMISRFWDNPYEQNLVHWGTELHDRFMLPHFVEQDLNEVIADLKKHDIDFDHSWLDPFIEFRFPRYGIINIGDIEIELRFAIEPWNVLGEEVTSTGTARYVDSSVERLQVKIKGMTKGRHSITCNGRKIPLHNTGTKGEFVGGVRYKAWSPPSGLHPSISAQAPLHFDLIDLWNEMSLGGCTYHVAHPGGRSYDSFPINSNEAEARRLSRFVQQGHTGGKINLPKEVINPDFPLTLDLRTQPLDGEM